MAEGRRESFNRAQRSLKAGAPHLAGRQARQPPNSWIEQEVRARLAEYEMTPEVTDRMYRCIEVLQEVAQDMGPTWRVRPFGSVANGYGTKFSDLDATCYAVREENEEEEEQKQPASEILGERLAPLLREHPQFTMAQEVLHARVPILKLCFEGKLEVDLSCHNTLPLQNTKLLKAYSSLDKRVRDLVITVKLWAKANEVCGASQSHLSSYALTLMAIYFMQVHPKIKLPMLPVAVFKENGADAEQKVAAARSSWTCALSLGQMVLRFFQFYSQEFSWGHEVVSVRHGFYRLDTSEQFVQKLKGRNFQRLHVEDPVDETRNLNCVLGEVQEMQLRRALQETYMRLQRQEPVRFGLPPPKETKEEPSADGEPGSSPGRTAIRVYDHLPQRPIAIPAPSVAEATGRPDAETTPNVRTHSLSEASTTASLSCASSTDEAATSTEEEHGAHAADSAYLMEEYEAGRAYDGHLRKERSGHKGTEAFGMPGTTEGYAGNPPLHTLLRGTGVQNAGKELLLLIKPDVSPPADIGHAQFPEPCFPLPQAPQRVPSILKTGQTVGTMAPPAAMPEKQPTASEQATQRRTRITRNIMAKVISTCEAHNQTEEKVWQ
ncbi:unnamed protein product [Effrenium voratum]|uniref:Uncharacterized protein n=1 Tax=Effrenium voratum TaxID=2562239 RepID=A0AA36MP51_9DINO|nr:unnamed protein product [Effrenium voratum]